MNDWIKEHPYMTFFLLCSAIAAPAAIISAARAPAELTPEQKAAIERDRLRQLTQGL